MGSEESCLCQCAPVGAAWLTSAGGHQRGLAPFIGTATSGLFGSDTPVPGKPPGGGQRHLQKCCENPSCKLHQRQWTRGIPRWKNSDSHRETNPKLFLVCSGGELLRFAGHCTMFKTVSWPLSSADFHPQPRSPPCKPNSTLVRFAKVSSEQLMLRRFS